MPKPITLPTHTCLRCAHTWVPRRSGRPGVCPKCKSAVWDRAKTRASGSLIVCPFCAARCPLTGDERRPIPFAEQYGDFEAYRCDCGALGSPSGDIGEAAWPLEQVEAALATLLKIPRGRAEVALNHVTGTDPPMLMLWMRKRKARAK